MDKLIELDREKQNQISNNKSGQMLNDKEFITGAICKLIIDLYDKVEELERKLKLLDSYDAGPPEPFDKGEIRG